MQKINYHKIQITHVCNDNCIFCYDKWNNKYWEKSQYDFSKSNIYKWIQKWFKKWYLNYIVFTWWEASTDKYIIEYIKYAKEIWFNKIELISNWVKFAFNNFSQKIIESWLTWINISVHWHNSLLHNYLTWNKIAFQSVLKWIINIKKINLNFDISIYIVINKLNLNYLDNIIILFSKLWIKNFYLLQLIPFGNVLKNEHIFINDNNILKTAVINILSKYSWTNISINASHLLHPNILEWYEKMIPNVENILWDIKINLWMNWKESFYSENFNRCNKWSFCHQCYLSSFCNQLEKSKNNSHNFNIGNLEYLPVLKLPDKYEDFIHKINNLKKDKKLVNIPKCILKEDHFYDNFKLYTQILSIEYNYTNFLKYFKKHWYLVKSLNCNKCKYNLDCNWINIRIIKKYWFKILNIIK